MQGLHSANKRIVKYYAVHFYRQADEDDDDHKSGITYTHNSVHKSTSTYS